MPSFSAFHRKVEVSHTNGCYHIAVGVKLFQDILNLQSRFVIQMLKNDILLLQNPGNLVFQELLIEELADLEADLCIFIRIERSDSGLCRTEGLSYQDAPPRTRQTECGRTLRSEHGQKPGSSESEPLCPRCSVTSLNRSGMFSATPFPMMLVVWL